MLAAREEKSRAAWREKLAVDFDVLGGAVKRRDRSGAGFVGKFDSGGNANRSDVAGEIEDAERRSFHAGLDAMEAGEKEFDQAKRVDLYAKVFDRTNTESYIFPVTSIPTVLAHTKEVGVGKDKYAAGDVWAASFFWNK